MAKYDKNIGENLYHQAKRLINKSINLKTAERDTNNDYICFEGRNRQLYEKRAVMCCSKCNTIKYFEKEDTKSFKQDDDYYSYYSSTPIQCPVCGNKLANERRYFSSFNNSVYLYKTIGYDKDSNTAAIIEMQGKPFEITEKKTIKGIDSLVLADFFPSQSNNDFYGCHEMGKYKFIPEFLLLQYYLDFHRYEDFGNDIEELVKEYFNKKNNMDMDLSYYCLEIDDELEVISIIKTMLYLLFKESPFFAELFKNETLFKNIFFEFFENISKLDSYSKYIKPLMNVTNSKAKTYDEFLKIPKELVEKCNNIDDVTYWTKAVKDGIQNKSEYEGSLAEYVKIITNKKTSFQESFNNKAKNIMKYSPVEKEKTVKLFLYWCLKSRLLPSNILNIMELGFKLMNEGNVKIEDLYYINQNNIYKNGCYSWYSYYNQRTNMMFNIHDYSEEQLYAECQKEVVNISNLEFLTKEGILSVYKNDVGEMVIKTKDGIILKEGANEDWI